MKITPFQHELFGHLSAYLLRHGRLITIVAAKEESVSKKRVVPYVSGEDF